MTPSTRSSPGDVLVTCGGKWVGIVLQLKAAMAAVPALRGGRVLVSSSEEATPVGTIGLATHALVLPTGIVVVPLVKAVVCAIVLALSMPSVIPLPRCITVVVDKAKNEHHGAATGKPSSLGGNGEVTSATEPVCAPCSQGVISGIGSPACSRMCFGILAISS